MKMRIEIVQLERTYSAEGLHHFEEENFSIITVTQKTLKGLGDLTPIGTSSNEKTKNEVIPVVNWEWLTLLCELLWNEAKK